MKQTKIKIGIIDSGLSPSTKITVAAEKDFTDSDLLYDRMGHGTAISDIIANKPGIEIYSAKVFHNSLRCTPITIYKAIEWLISVKVDIINMSFGIKNDRSILREVCEQALSKKILIIAAAPAQGKPIYPAFYNGIIRATGDARCRPNEISWLDSSQADFGAYVGDQKLKISGASTGCAYVTRITSRVMLNMQQYDFNAIYNKLTEIADYRGTEKRFC